MKTDFPAAHSMDTIWFAVDRDGHVGHFSTGEGGALPITAMQGDPYEVRDLLAALLPRGEAYHDLQGYLMPGPQREAARHQPGDRRSTALMFLASLEPVRPQVTGGIARPVATSSGVAVVFDALTAALHRSLHEGGHCLGCFAPEDFDEGLPQACAALGLYHYNHPTYYSQPDRSQDAIAGPYRRIVVPRYPVHIDQLPPGPRAVVVQTVFSDCCFAATPYIQPCATREVECENAAYLTVDGCEIHALTDPAAEDYREFYAWLLREEPWWLKGIVVEPPG